ncbi:hypothetical protein [Actinomyces vulturis]|uniref:hypothetical protein n=1 Tax=Actinomyces vulturis TaxID=1857645 RepID=UPI00083100E1|nr:hypothetical protein [Actinomyces vulturis]
MNVPLSCQWAEFLRRGIPSRQSLSSLVQKRSWHCVDLAGSDELIQTICRSQPDAFIHLVLIDGFSGSGKTTLTDAVLSDKIPRTVHRIAVDYYVHGWDALHDAVTAIRCELEKLLAWIRVSVASCENCATCLTDFAFPDDSHTVALGSFDWDIMASGAEHRFTVHPGDVVIIEGCGSWLTMPVDLHPQSVMVMDIPGPISGGTECLTTLNEDEEQFSSPSTAQPMSCLRLWMNTPASERALRVSTRDSYTWPREAWDHTHRDLLTELIHREQWPPITESVPE